MNEWLDFARQSRSTWLRDFTFTFHFRALEKEMATHSSVLAWRIPGMGEPGGLWSMGSHRVGHCTWSFQAPELHKVITFSYSLLGCDNFSNLSYCWWPWHFSREPAKYFADCPSVGICIMYISCLDWNNMILEEGPQRWSAIFITLFWR